MVAKTTQWASRRRMLRTVTICYTKIKSESPLGWIHFLVIKEYPLISNGLFSSNHASPNI